MARTETWFDQDLKKPVSVRIMAGMQFSEDNQGSLIGVRVYDDGADATLTGGATGYCILADGQTITVDGTREGNTAYILLPQSALLVPGPIQITIKLVDDGVITTLLACVGTVIRTKIGVPVVPGSVIEEWSEQISETLQECVDDCQAAADAMGANLAAAYSSSATYPVGSYVIQSGTLYRCTTAVTTAGSWSTNSGKFTAVKLGNDVSDLKSALKNTNQLEIIDNWNTGHYYANGSSVETVDINNPSSNGNYSCLVVPCSTGDVFEYIGESSNVARCVSFLSSADGTGNKLTMSNYQYPDKANSYFVSAPNDAVYMIANKKNSVSCLIQKYTKSFVIHENGDLNNCTKEGRYFCPSTVISASVTHKPVDITTSFEMEVVPLSVSNANEFCQIIIANSVTASTMGTYLRTHRSTGFSEWECILGDWKDTIFNRVNKDLITLYGRTSGTFDFPSINKFAKNESLKSTGDYQTYVGWWSSDLIDVTPIIGETLYFSGHGYYSASFTISPVIFLDSNKEIVSYYAIDKSYNKSVVKGSIVVPASAVYMLLTSYWVDPGHTGYEETDKYPTEVYIFGESDSLPMPILKRKDIKIICCGDSITEGDYGSNPSGTENTHPESYPYFLAKYLGVNMWKWDLVDSQYTELTNAQDINVINLGRNGSRPKSWYNNIYVNYKDLFKYETNKRIVVVMMFGANGGITDTVDEDTASGDYETYANTETGRYCRVIEEIMGLSEGHAEIILCTAPYVNPNTRPTNAANVATANPVTKKIAAKYNLPVIDTFAELGLSIINTSVLQPIDGLHFGFYGYSRLGTFIGSKIKGLLSFTYDIPT